jgi:hypothetical protein
METSWDSWFRSCVDSDVEGKTGSQDLMLALYLNRQSKTKAYYELQIWL